MVQNNFGTRWRRYKSKAIAAEKKPIHRTSDNTRDYVKIYAVMYDRQDKGRQNFGMASADNVKSSFKATCLIALRNRMQTCETVLDDHYNFTAIQEWENE